ncbi:hypothetical protein EDB81DRAFT_931852 [Dactylonectria macrodidyma]|uniref:Uncharacterized protein n=1 Tax=Dactylonectria macrodidyma TaxID=307937 RepID=A0A9P9F657_9HYPO|nr:hypothetical protein EDB81DRAFT_931852 [Dactylonectria macrodidyma]
MSSNNFSPMDDSLPRDNRFRLVPRLGKISTAVFASLFVVCLGCLAFLAFLWAADTNNTVWRSIVLSGWTTRSVTITSLVLRWATASQAATCTSMLAAILLQKGAVPLPAAAAVSIFRFDNKGPWSLLGKMGVKWYHGSTSIALLAAMLSVTTLSLQFTSTVLLSQVGLATLPVTIYVPQTRYGLDTDGPTYGSQLSAVPHFMDTTPASYPAFAEWISNATTSDTAAQYGEFAPNKGHGIIDTGTVVRVFLPINDTNERSRLAEYHGFGTAVDTRVVCMRPKVTNVEFSTDSGFRVTGLADNEQKPLGLLRQADSEGSANFSLPFDCGFAAVASHDWSSELYGWPLALCRPNYDWDTKAGIYSVMEREGQEQLGGTYLLINATMVDAVTELDGSDVWESMTLKPVGTSVYEGVSLQFTLCMTAFAAQDMDIEATRPALITPEPALLWNTLTATYDAEAVLRQLGANTSSVPIAERGIFDLASRSWQRPPEDQDPLDLSSGTFSTTRALGMVNDDVYGETVNNAQYSIFALMASSTANPALALQAYFTTLCAVSYYDQITMFDTAAPSSQLSLVQVTRPLGWTAFSIVVSVVVLHCLLIFLVTLIFQHAGSLSQIQNAWASVSQLLGPTTDDWIKGANNVDDKTVELWLKARGLQKTFVGVGDVQSRVQLVEKHKVT